VLHRLKCMYPPPHMTLPGVAPAQGAMHVTNRARVHAKHTTFQFVGVASPSLTQEEGGGGGGLRHAVRASGQAVVFMSLSLFQNCELGISVQGCSDTSVRDCYFSSCHAAFDAQGEGGGGGGEGGGQSVVDGEEEMVKEQGCGGGNGVSAGRGWASSVRTARRRGEEGRGEEGRGEEWSGKEGGEEGCGGGGGEEVGRGEEGKGEEGRGGHARGCQLAVEWCLFTAGKVCVVK